MSNDTFGFSSRTVPVMESDIDVDNRVGVVSRWRNSDGSFRATVQKCDGSVRRLANQHNMRCSLINTSFHFDPRGEEYERRVYALRDTL